MAYYFYNTAERLETKVNELEAELQQAENKFNVLVAGNGRVQDLNELGLDIENLRRKLKFFSDALQGKTR